MMNCADVRENISAYADNELSVNERKAFEEHISSCAGCKKELDDMIRIIKLCRNMPMYDLPESFRGELHEKLAAVASRNDNAVTGADKAKRKLTARTFASIAAGILLIFLGGSIVRFGLLSGKLAKHAPETDKVSSAAESPYGYSAADGAGIRDEGSIDEYNDSFGIQFSEKTDDMPETTDAVAEPKGSDKLMAVPRGLDINRSSCEEVRENGIILGMAEAETVSLKTSELSVTAEDPATAMETITALATGNNGTWPVNKAAAYGQEGISDITGYGDLKEDEEARLELQIVFAEADYRMFVAALNDTFGAANIQTGAFVIEDRTDELNMLIDQTNTIDQTLRELQERDGESSAGEINELIREKKEIDSRIESLRLNTDFITVTIYINKK